MRLVLGSALLLICGCASGFATYEKRTEWGVAGEPPSPTVTAVVETCTVKGIAIGPATMAANFASTSYDEPKADGTGKLTSDSTGSTLAGCAGIQGAHPASGVWAALIAAIAAIGGYLAVFGPIVF